MKQKKYNPDDPEFMERILARIDAMSPDELLALLRRRPEGVEETNMNETLKQYYREKQEAEAKSKVA